MQQIGTLLMQQQQTWILDTLAGTSSLQDYLYRLTQTNLEGKVPFRTWFQVLQSLHHTEHSHKYMHRYSIVILIMRKGTKQLDLNHSVKEKAEVSVQS